MSDPKDVGPTWPFLALALSGLLMVGAAIFVVPEHAALSVALVGMGGGVAVLGVLISRMKGEFELSIRGLRGQLRELEENVEQVSKTVGEVSHTVDALLVKLPRIDSPATTLPDPEHE